jgi:hypothetical protein
LRDRPTAPRSVASHYQLFLGAAALPGRHAQRLGRSHHDRGRFGSEHPYVAAGVDNETLYIKGRHLARVGNRGQEHPRPLGLQT